MLFRSAVAVQAQPTPSPSPSQPIHFRSVLSLFFCSEFFHSLIFLGYCDFVVSVFGIFCLRIFCYFVAWILCSLYWEFSVCRNWLCGLCGLCIGNFVFWKFCVLEIFCYFVVWILCTLYWEFSVCKNWLCGLCGL